MIATIAKPPRLRSGRPVRSPIASAGRLEYRTADFRATGVSSDGSYFEGYAAVFNNIDEYGTIMAVGCFDRDLDTFRTEGFLGGINHDWSNPIGRPEVVRVDSRGLFVGGSVLDTTHGSDVKRWLAAGVVRKLSFGFDVLEQEWLDGPDEVEAYWKSVGYRPAGQDRERARDGALLFKRLKVYEASPVMVPGNALADITAVRSMQARVAAAAGRRMANMAEAAKLRRELILLELDVHCPAALRPADPSDVAALRRSLRELGISPVSTARTRTR